MDNVPVLIGKQTIIQSEIDEDEHGIITCPLYGLKFNFETKQIVTKFEKW